MTESYRRALEIGAIVLATALGSNGAVEAAAASGTFGFVPIGAVTADTGDLTGTTGAVTYPDRAVVNTALGGNLGVSVGDAVALSDLTFPFPPGSAWAPVLLAVTVDGLTFTFTRARTIDRIATGAGAGFLDEEMTGSLTVSGGRFDLGAPATLAHGCDQPAPTGAIDCSVTTVTAGAISEPGAFGLALLGAGLMWFSVRRRPAGATA
jgi:hypothetical protein